MHFVFRPERLQNSYYRWYKARDVFHTLKGVEDGEDVEGGDLQGAVGEESEAPAEAQDAAEPHDGQSVGGAAGLLWHGDAGAFTSEQEDPAQHHHEGEKREDEDGAVVADVDDVVHGWVGDPAPTRTKQLISREFSQSSEFQNFITCTWVRLF